MSLLSFRYSLDKYQMITLTAILRDPSGSASGLADVQSGARELALETVIFDASDPSRFDKIFAEALGRNVNGVAGMASAFLNFHHKRLVELANQHPSLRSGRHQGM